MAVSGSPLDEIGERGIEALDQIDEGAERRVAPTFLDCKDLVSVQSDGATDLDRVRALSLPQAAQCDADIRCGRGLVARWPVQQLAKLREFVSPDSEAVFYCASLRNARHQSERPKSV